jgi:nucleoside phosphorylase
MPCAVILTALPVEYRSVRAFLTNLQEEVHAQGTVYERGRFLVGERRWNVGIVEIGAGNAGAALEAERAIAYFNPDVILFVGVAGGIKDVVLGDVVASTKVYGYESGKAGELFLPRPGVGLTDYGLEQRAKAEARKDNWLKRIRSIEPSPRVFVAPIAAGEKVVSSMQSEVFRFIRSNYGDAVALEMEGFGFLEAVRANRRVSAMVIRGISDLIDGKADADGKGSQEVAAHHASAFAFEMLAKLEMGGVSNAVVEKVDMVDFPGEFEHLREKFVSLERLLLDKRWQAANLATRSLMLLAVGREKDQYLGEDDLENFPAVVLERIDQLWVGVSDGRFGFGVQKVVMESCGEDVRAFAERVGWLREDVWVEDSTLVADLVMAPIGHFPWRVLPHVELNNAALNAFVSVQRSVTKSVAGKGWPLQVLVDFMDLVGRPIGQGVDKEEFKRGLAYELSHDEAWWEGGRFEELLVRKLFALLRNKNFALSYSSSAKTVTGVEPVSISIQSTVVSMTPKKIFFAYSREDEHLRNKLAEHLSMLRQQGVISEWHDRCINPGDEWRSEIDENLKSADIILLLVSSSFLASKYCCEVEMRTAIERHESGESIVIPVILRAVEWAETPIGIDGKKNLGELNALPKNGEPIISSNWNDQDEAFRSVAKGIGEIVKKNQKFTSPEPKAPISTPIVLPIVKTKNYKS